MTEDINGNDVEIKKHRRNKPTVPLVSKNIIRWINYFLISEPI